MFYRYIIAASFSLFIIPFSAIAEDDIAVEEAALLQLMQAISQQDYESFISNGTPRFKQGITKQAFNSVVK